MDSYTDEDINAFMDGGIMSENMEDNTQVSEDNKKENSSADTEKNR